MELTGSNTWKTFRTFEIIIVAKALPALIERDCDWL
jgi:hypothetical protein